MNLHLKIDNHEIELWKTPTHITNMCLVDAYFKISFEVKGEEALRAISMYSIWVKNSLNGVWENQEEYKSQLNLIVDHLSYINDSIRNSKGDIVVYKA